MAGKETVEVVDTEEPVFLWLGGGASRGRIGMGMDHRPGLDGRGEATMVESSYSYSWIIEWGI